MARTYGRGGKATKESGEGLAPKKPSPPVRQPFGVFGSMTPVNPRYLFGEPEEIDDRIATGYVTPPENAAPRFEQIRPGPAGTNANEPSFNGGSKSVGRPYVGNPRRFA